MKHGQDRFRRLGFRLGGVGVLALLTAMPLGGEEPAPEAVAEPEEPLIYLEGLMAVDDAINAVEDEDPELDEALLAKLPEIEGEVESGWDATPEDPQDLEPFADERPLIEAWLADPSDENSAALARLRFAHSIKQTDAGRGGANPAALQRAFLYAQSAAHLDPTQGMYQYWVGKLYALDRGNPISDALAESCLLGALELAPSMSKARLVLADLYVSRGDYSAAFAQLLRLVKEAPPELAAESIAALARAYQESGRVREGIAFFDVLATNQPPDLVAVRLAAGALRLLADDRAGAEPLLKEVTGDPEASGGALRYASLLLDERARAAKTRATGAPFSPTGTVFWTEYATALLDLQSAAEMLEIPFDPALNDDCDQMASSSSGTLAGWAEAAQKPADLARVHAAFYLRGQKEIDALALAVWTNGLSLVEELEAAPGEEDEAEDCLEDCRNLVQVYGALVGGLAPVFRTRADLAEAAAAAAGLRRSESPEGPVFSGGEGAGRWTAAELPAALLNPFRAKIAAWHDYAVELEDYLLQEPDEPMPEKAAAGGTP